MFCSFCIVFGNNIIVGGVVLVFFDFNVWVLIFIFGLLRVFLNNFLICLLWVLLVVGLIILDWFFLLIKVLFKFELILENLIFWYFFFRKLIKWVFMKELRNKIFNFWFLCSFI